MKQKKVIFYMFLTIIGGGIFVGSQAWEWKNFIKGEYGAVETKGGQILQFLDTEGHRVSLADIAVIDHHKDRAQHEKKSGIWYESEGMLPTYSIDEIRAGFAKNKDLLIRTQTLTQEGEKTILSREESLRRLTKDAVGIVEGANLQHNEYGTPLFANFFFFITGFHGFHVFSGVIINIIIFITGFHGFHVFSGILINVIIFFNVILGTYEKRGHYEMVEKVGLYWHFVDLVWVFVFTFFYLV